MSRSTRHYGIRRIDIEVSRTHCWLVTIQCRGIIHRSYFSDGVYGGKQKAFAAAKVWRDRIIEKYPPLSPREYSSIVKKNNRSGVAGGMPLLFVRNAPLAARTAVLVLGGIMDDAGWQEQARQIFGK